MERMYFLNNIFNKFIKIYFTRQNRFKKIIPNPQDLIVNTIEQQLTGFLK